MYVPSTATSAVRIQLTGLKIITHQLDVIRPGPDASHSVARTSSPQLTLQLLNSLFPPHVRQYPDELIDRNDILCIRQRIYVFLMNNKEVSSANREIFQTQLLGMVKLGSWPGHIRQSLSEYFDKVEKTRRMYAEVVAPTAPPTPTTAAPPMPPMPPRSILKSRKGRGLSGAEGDSSRSARPSRSSENLIARIWGMGKNSNSTGAESSKAPTQSAPTPGAPPSAPPSAPTVARTSFIAHPALRSLNLSMTDLAERGLALPKAVAGHSAHTRSVSSTDGSPGCSSPPATAADEEVSMPTAGETKSSTLRLRRAPSRIELKVTTHPGLERATSPQPQPQPLDKSEGSKGPGGLATARGAQPGRRALYRLRSGLKSTEGLFSKFKGAEKQPPVTATVASEEVIAVDRPTTALSTRSVSKSVRFSDEVSSSDIPAKKSLWDLLPKKKLVANPWLYTRAYQIEKAAAAKEGRDCRLPPANLKWRWSDEDDGDFCIRPKTPREIETLPPGAAGSQHLPAGLDHGTAVPQTAEQGLIGDPRHTVESESKPQDG